MCRNPDRCPTHPGELLREDMIPATKKSKAEIARVFGISRQHLHDILTERKSVSPDVAVRLAKLFGNMPLFWIRMQGAYDAWHASREVNVQEIPTLISADFALQTVCRLSPRSTKSILRSKTPLAEPPQHMLSADPDEETLTDAG